MAKARIRKINLVLLSVSAFLVSAVAVFIFLAGEIYEYQDTFDGVHLPKVDVIVCLAGGRGRIAEAADVWNRYRELALFPVKEAGKSPAPSRNPVLYISGMGPQANWNVFLRNLRRGVRDVITPSDVVIENRSSNTYENAVVFSIFAQARGWERMLLITSRYHMKRARQIFEKVVPPPLSRPLVIETLSVYQEPFEPGEWRWSLHGIRVSVIEYLKWIYFRATL